MKENSAEEMLGEILRIRHDEKSISRQKYTEICESEREATERAMHVLPEEVRAHVARLFDLMIDTENAYCATVCDGTDGSMDPRIMPSAMTLLLGEWFRVHARL